MLRIPAEYDFFKNHPQVQYLWENTSCEIVYFYRILKLVLEHPISKGYIFYVLNREPLPERNKKVITIQVGMEDHGIPKYISKVGLTFTTYPPSGPVPENLKNIPLGYNGDLPTVPMIPFSERSIDAFFSGQNSNNRGQIGAVAKRLKKMEIYQNKNLKIHYSKGFRTGYGPEQYAENMMDAKIAFVPRGTQSPITFRLFEAARAGNVILSCPLPVTWYFKKFPGIQIENWGNAEEILMDLWDHPEKMESIHQQTLDHYEKYCSEKAVANYIIQEIRKID